MRSVVATFATAALLVVGASGTAFAKEVSHQFTGQISSLNTATHTLAVKETAKPMTEMTFTLSPGAKIMADSKATTLSGLTVGESVSVKYSDDGSTHLAHEVDAHPKAASVKPAAEN